MGFVELDWVRPNNRIDKLTVNLAHIVSVHKARGVREDYLGTTVIELSTRQTVFVKNSYEELSNHLVSGAERG